MDSSRLRDYPCWPGGSVQESPAGPMEAIRCGSTRLRLRMHGGNENSPIRIAVTTLR